MNCHEHRIVGRGRAGDVALADLLRDRGDQIDALDVDILEFLQVPKFSKGT
jgi:hypothetical protein